LSMFIYEMFILGAHPRHDEKRCIRGDEEHVRMIYSRD
jgi:hypothetical protein